MKEQKYLLIKITAFLFAGAGVLKITSLLFQQIGDELIMAVPAYLVSIFVIVVLAVCLHETEWITGFGNGWKEGCRRGWYVLIVSGVFLATLGIGLAGEKNLVFSLTKIFRFALVCFLTACFEEIWFRGIILGLLEKLGKMKNTSFWITACISSALFAAMHLLNLFHRPEYVLGTLTQVVYTFSLGMILSVVVYGNGNIGPAILLHAMFNFCGSLSEVFLRTESAGQGDMTAASAVYILVLMLPGLFFARRIFRKTELKLKMGRAG